MTTRRSVYFFIPTLCCCASNATAALAALKQCRKAEKNFFWRTCYGYSLTQVLRQTIELIVESESGWACGIWRWIAVHELDGCTIRITATTGHRPTCISHIHNRRASSREIHDPRRYSAYAEPMAELVAKMAAVPLQRVVFSNCPLFLQAAHQS